MAHLDREQIETDVYLRAALLLAYHTDRDVELTSAQVNAVNALFRQQPRDSFATVGDIARGLLEQSMRELERCK